MKTSAVLMLLCSALLGCGGGFTNGNNLDKPSYQDYLNIETGSSCSSARSKISGDWKLDSSSEFGDPGDIFYTKSEMWSVTGGFWSVSIMCSNGTVDFVSQFGLD